MALEVFGRNNRFFLILVLKLAKILLVKNYQYLCI